MKNKFVFCLLLATIISGQAYATTLAEALKSAYETNPALEGQRAALRAIDENMAIAKSGYRPTMSVSGQYKDVHANNNVVKVQDGYSRSLSANLVQPIFRGFKTVNSMKSADSYIRAEQNNLYNTEQDVILATATAYLDVMRDDAIVKLRTNNENLLKKRMEETNQRYNVGELTRTDVSQAKARYSAAKSERIASEGNLLASKANYKEVVGEEAGDLVEPTWLPEFFPTDFEAAKQEALENNYSVQYAKHLLAYKDYEIKNNIGDLLPSVNLNANATRGTEESYTHKDPTTNSAYVGVSLDVPLYAGGASRAKIRKSKYEKWQAQDMVQQAERAAISAVTSSWEYMNANKAKIASVKDQIQAYEVALDGVRKEESLGNRTVLDVLDAYQDLLNSQVEEVSALRDYYVSGLQMLASVGKLTAENLKLDVELYQPKKYYKETRDKWLSLSVDE